MYAISLVCFSSWVSPGLASSRLFLGVAGLGVMADTLMTWV